MYDTRKRERAWDTYVPVADDILSPPPQRADSDPRRDQPDSRGLGTVITTANGLVTLIIIVGMATDGQQVGKAIITGGLYFAVTTVMYMFVITGALTAIVATWQHERTERRRIDAYADAAERVVDWRIRIEKNRALELRPPQQHMHQIPVEGTQTPSHAPTFVPPYDKPDETAETAMRWARGLYLPNGQPNPKRVQTTGDNAGWLRVRMLGSKRDTGSREAGAWLMHRQVIERAPNGYRLRLEHFPTRESLRGLR